ncbi:MAG TPA: hypothetical protein VFB19_00990 [Mycobacterium sp.]|nr:hypothetical protein [Mycobacterium sp.]
MERLAVRYAALACAFVGGVLVSGSGAVAFADPTGSGGTSGTDTTASATPSTTAAQPVYGANVPPAYKAPLPGPVSVPEFNIPSPFGTLTLPAAKLPLQWGPITFPNLMSSQSPTATLPGPSSSPAGQAGTSQGAPSPAGSQSSSGVAASVASTPSASPPTISLVPPGTPPGSSVTITNPLRAAFPVDLHAPIMPQVLPPPVVTILNAMSQQVPLTDLVLAPLMNDTLPPLLSDVILPALLSDIVVPTLPIESGLPTVPVAGAMSLSNPAIWAPPASGPPPLELAAMGMDAPQAPLQTPAPLTPAVSDQGPQQNPPPPPPNSVKQLSEPVAYRAGYSDYLRNAGMAQITSLALPGIAGILLVTAGGGFIGYRQARAGHVIRAEGIARFLR